MRHNYSLTVRVGVFDEDGESVRDSSVLRQLDGLDYRKQSMLDFIEVDFDQSNLRGGFLRVKYDRSKNQVFVVGDIDSREKLRRSDVSQLREEMIGQLIDGIGSSAFDEVKTKFGLLQIDCGEYPSSKKFKQETGNAWIPRGPAKTKSPAKKKSSKGTISIAQLANLDYSPTTCDELAKHAISIPKFSKDNASSCPATLDEIAEEASDGTGGSSAELKSNLKFLSTGVFEEYVYWVWEFEYAGDTYLVTCRSEAKKMKDSEFFVLDVDDIETPEQHIYAFHFDIDE